MSLDLDEKAVDDVEDERRAIGLAGLVRAAGRPYILITVVDEATGASDLTSAGIAPDQIAPALREIADLLDEAQP